MKRQFLFAACTLFAASALLMTSCQQAEEPIANDPTDQAGPMTRAATLGNFYRVVYQAGFISYIRKTGIVILRGITCRNIPIASVPERPD